MSQASERNASNTVWTLVRMFVWTSVALLLLLSPARRAGALIPAPADPSSARFAGPAPARGRLLIAARTLGDPRFAHTVILLVEYGAHGAVGVIINFPTEITLGEALPKIGVAVGRTDRIYRGGPVGRDHLLLLVRAPEAPENSSPVMSDLYLTASLDTLRQVIGAERSFHAYAGYAGWAPGQLEGEIARGDWHVSDGDSEMVFEKQPETLWPRLIRSNSGQWVHGPVPGGGYSRAVASDRRR